MGLFNNTININHVLDEETKKLLVKIHKNQKKIMANVQELTDLVDGLQVSVDALQEKVTTTITALDATIADLTDQLANGATPAQVQALVDKLTATKADLEATQV
jgi:predicted  nucleic acid-binding Zn-ribbon protein